MRARKLQGTIDKKTVFHYNGTGMRGAWASCGPGIDGCPPKEEESMTESKEIEYRNAYYQPGENPVFCYRTGLTVYEEVFADGKLTVGGWNAAGYPLNVLGSGATRMAPDAFARPEAFDLQIGGASCSQELSFVSFQSEEEDETHTHCVLTLKNERCGTEILVHTQLDGTPVFSRWLEIRNLTDAPAAVGALAVMSGGIERLDLGRYQIAKDPSEVYDLGYMDNPEWGCEGDFSWHSLSPDEHAFGGRYSRSRYRYPMFALRNNLRGTVLIGQLAYSAGYRFSFDYQAGRFPQNTAALSFRAEIDSFAPLYVLSPGETLTTPVFHIGMVQGDYDDAVNAMLDHIRRSVLTLEEADGSACKVGSGMGPEHDMLLDTTKSFIDQMAAAGAEVFIIDAGWYVNPDEGTAGKLWWTKAGHWYFSPERYPNGLKEVLDYAKSKGLGLGLWMEVERIGTETELYREHSDWFTVHEDGKRSSGYLDLTKPEVLDWCEAEATRVIREYGLSLFRIDYNVSGVEYFHTAENGPFRECRAMRQVEAFYTLYRRLKKKFPDVIFENCAGGGGRADLGMVANFNHSWVTDNQISPRSVLITNGMTMVLPPERVDRLVAGMGCHTIGSLDLHMRNAMLTHMTLNGFGQKDCEMNPKLFSFVRRSVDLYKSFIRPFLPTCRVYHHTPDTPEALRRGFCILEDAARDGTRGAIGIFSMPDAQDSRVTVVPKGVRADLDYRVVFDNTGAERTVSGYELLRDGIPVSVPASLSSELVLYESV